MITVPNIYDFIEANKEKIISKINSIDCDSHDWLGYSSNNSKFIIDKSGNKNLVIIIKSNIIKTNGRYHSHIDIEGNITKTPYESDVISIICQLFRVNKINAILSNK